MSKTFTHKLTEEEHAMICNLLDKGFEYYHEFNMFDSMFEREEYKQAFDKVYGAKPDARKGNEQ